MTIIAEGKTKSLYQTDDAGQLRMLFRNDVTAFDGTKKAQLAGKGEINNRFNAEIMTRLQQAGISTHHIEMISENESLVHNLQMLPIECVVRNISAGSICRRLGIEEGLEMSPVIFEFFLKDDDLGDPMICESHIESFGWAKAEHVEQMRTLTLKVNDVLQPMFRDADMLLVDFKIEFGIDTEGELRLGDEFTPDGCRVWDAETKKKLDKDRFRLGLDQEVEAYMEIAHRIGVQVAN